MNHTFEYDENLNCTQARIDTIQGMPITMAYVPWQSFHAVYEPDKALREGTIFPELNKPFGGRKLS